MVHWMLEVGDGGIDLGVWTINWVYRIPCMASVIGNAVFLMLIIGVLVFKLSSPRLPAPSAGACFSVAKLSDFFSAKLVPLTNRIWPGLTEFCPLLWQMKLT